MLVISWPLGHTATSTPNVGAPWSWHGALRCCLRFLHWSSRDSWSPDPVKDQVLQCKDFCSWSCCLFPLCPTHLCQPQSTPQPGHSQVQVQWRLIVPQGLFSFVLLLLLVVVFFVYKFSMVCSEYRKQPPTFDCSFSYSECGTKSVKDLKKIGNLTICPHEYT